MVKNRDVSRTKLFRMVQSCHIEDHKFRPTQSDCVEVFNNINRQVFYGELKLPRFRLLYSKDYWGMCVGSWDDPAGCTININKSFLSKRLFINTVAHEMVHQWEWLNHEHMTHGTTFFVWRKPLAEFGITLSRSYRIKHYKLN